MKLEDNILDQILSNAILPNIELDAECGELRYKNYIEIDNTENYLLNFKCEITQSYMQDVCNDYLTEPCICVSEPNIEISDIEIISDFGNKLTKKQIKKITKYLIENITYAL